MSQRSLTQSIQLRRQIALVAALFWALLLCAPAYFISLPCAACLASAYLPSTGVHHLKDASCLTPQRTNADCPMPCCRASASTISPRSASVRFLKSTRVPSVDRSSISHCCPDIVCSVSIVIPHNLNPSYAIVDVQLTDANLRSTVDHSSLTVRGPPNYIRPRLDDVPPHRSSGLSPPLV